MINIIELSSDEKQKLKVERITSYWALPLGLTFIFAILNLIFQETWQTFFWLSGGVWFLFICSWLLWYKEPTLTVKIVRRGKIIRAEYLGNNPIAKLNIGQHIDITFEEENVPENYLTIHTFTVWQSTKMIYYKQDENLRFNYKELIGKEVEIAYLPENSTVIAFRGFYLTNN